MHRQRGFSATELLVAAVLLAMVALIGVPAFLNTIQRSRHGGAVRQALSEFREARSNAISTGWEYRIVGFDKDSGANPNRYRVFARSSSSVSWPLDTVAPSRTADLIAGPWFDVANEFHGVTLDAGAMRFELTFDARGTATSTGFSPLSILGADSLQEDLIVTTSGNVKVQ